MTEKSGFRGEYSKTPTVTGGRIIEYSDPEEERALSELAGRPDFEAARLKRLLALPDLTRREHSPLKFIVDGILKLAAFRNFDIVIAPETFTVEDGFNLFNFPDDHPSRRPSDTYFAAPNRVLRTHTTSMWLYYLRDPEVRERLRKNGWLGELCYGKVYRKDEIDASHFPVFHQIDGLFISKIEIKKIGLKDLEEVLADIVKSVFGPAVKYRFLDDNFPFTDPSTQIEIEWKGKWLEIVGAGIVHKKVLRNFDLDPEIYNGWAFGFGLERLAMIKNGIPDIRIFWSEDPRIASQFKNIESQYRAVSKYPAIVRDISFIARRDAAVNKFYEIVRHSAGDLVEEVRQTDEFEDEKKFGAEKKSFTFRIIYRSHERTLTSEEINEVHRIIENLAVKEMSAKIR